MSVCNFYSLTPEQLLTPLIYSQSGILTGWKHDSWLAADHKKSRTAAQLREVGVEVGWVASLQKNVADTWWAFWMGSKYFAQFEIVANQQNTLIFISSWTQHFE